MTNPEQFVRETRSVVRMEVDGSAWIKPGAAIAYRGRIRFERLATIDAPTARDAVFRELAPLVRAVGRGTLYCGHHGAHLLTRRLAGETMVVAWDNVLAFESSLSFEAAFVEHAVGIVAGGVIVIKLSGHGAVALATHGEPLTLPVTPGDSINTDPHATVAWSGTLSPALEMDVSWRTAVGHGGQQAVQMKFAGDGFVIVQPSRNEPHVTVGLKTVRRLSTLAGA